MKWANLLLLATCLGAQAAVPESFVFVRNGRVWFQAAGSDRVEPVIADDPGWTYVHPTFIDAGTLLVIRNKGGQWGRSHVGVLNIGQRPVSPSKIKWLPKLAGAHAVGLCPDGGITFLKVATTGEEEATIYLGSADSDGGNVKSKPVYKAMYGAGEAVRNGLRSSWDGLISVPIFPTDVSNTIALYDWNKRALTNPKYMDWEWLSKHDLAAEWCSAAFGGNRWVALGSLRMGIWLVDREKGQMRQVEGWSGDSDPTIGVPSICFHANTECFYYEVGSPWGDGNPVPEIRRATPEGGKPTLVIKNASMPDIMPPFS